MGGGGGDKAEDWALIPLQTLYSIHPSIHPSTVSVSIYFPSICDAHLPFYKVTNRSINSFIYPSSVHSNICPHPSTHSSIHPPTFPSMFSPTPTRTPIHLSILPPSHPSVHPSTHSLVIISAFLLQSFHQSSTATYLINLPAYPTAQTSLFPPPLTHQSSQLCSKPLSISPSCLLLLIHPVMEPSLNISCCT